MATYLQTLLRAWKRFVFVHQWRICEHFSLSHSFVLDWKPYNTFRGRWISSWLLDCFLIHQIKLSIHSVFFSFYFLPGGKTWWMSRHETPGVKLGLLDAFRPDYGQIQTMDVIICCSKDNIHLMFNPTNLIDLKKIVNINGGETWNVV